MLFVVVVVACELTLHFDHQQVCQRAVLSMIDMTLAASIEKRSVKAKEDLRARLQSFI